MMFRLSTLAAVAVGLALCAGRGTAAEPQAPDLTELKDAVTAADKRGDNVEAIRDALTAFEKAVTKGNAAKPGATAPPELTALRDAVEAAGRKGENVAEISKQLGLIEKALTGRAYERPKPPPPPPEPALPKFNPRREGFGRGGRGGFGGRIVIGNAGNGNSMSVVITNGDFTIRAKQGVVSYLITGQSGANGAEVAKIHITDGEKKIEATELKKVPDAYRPTVERLLKSVRGR